MIKHENVKDSIIVLLFFWLAFLYQDRINIEHDKEVLIQMVKECSTEYYILKTKGIRYGK